MEERLMENVVETVEAKPMEIPKMDLVDPKSEKKSLVKKIGVGIAAALTISGAIVAAVAKNRTKKTSEDDWNEDEDVDWEEVEECEAVEEEAEEILETEPEEEN